MIAKTRRLQQLFRSKSASPLSRSPAVQEDTDIEVDVHPNFEQSPSDYESDIPASSSMPHGCIFVGNLDSSKTDVQLYESVEEHFRQWGKVSDLKIDRDRSGRPFAFVQFQRIADAKRVISEPAGHIIGGRPIRVEAAKVVSTLYVKYDPGISRETVEQQFTTFGHVEKFVFLRYAGTNELKGCVFVRYFRRSDALKAYTACKKSSIWTTEWAKSSKTFEVDRRSLFVGRLNPALVSDAEIRSKFEKYGEVLSVKLFNAANEKKAFAFVQYANEEDAELAIDELHGSKWLDSIISVQYREIDSLKPGHGPPMPAQHISAHPQSSWTEPLLSRPTNVSELPYPQMPFQQPFSGPYIPAHGQPILPMSYYPVYNSHVMVQPIPQHSPAFVQQLPQYFLYPMPVFAQIPVAYPVGSSAALRRQGLENPEHSEFQQYFPQ
ncbi:hypothetical protein HDU84_007008 [Entophlyctis sp. JEL0112]|nr:hypothetical protein HDU84_007008 [Entophlyctis sp. JEL0112]